MQIGPQTSGNKAWLGAALCMLLGLLCACIPQRRTGAHVAESLEEGMRRAVDLQRQGLYTEAAQLYRSVLRSHPENALAHFELGILLQDHRKDEAAAIYHFRNYLDLRPDSEKASVARERLLSAEKKLGQRHGGEGDSSSRVVSDVQIVERLEQLNALVAERDRSVQQYRDDIATLTRENERLAKEVRSLNNRLQLMLVGYPPQKPPSQALRDRSLGLPETEAPPRRPTTPVAQALPPAGPPTTPPATPAARPGDRTYRVQRGDSLWSIAQKVYGDPSRSTDIRNANRGRVGANDRLTEGDELRIPFP